MNILITLLLTLTMAACSYPVSQVSITDNRPALLIKNAPKDAVLFVDGVQATAALTTPPQAILLPSGTHNIEVKTNGNTIFSEKVFLSDGTIKTLTVN